MTDDPPHEHRQRSDATDATRRTVSTDYKVRGKKAAPGGTGVLGHNTATTGDSYGVEGVTESDSAGAAGVRGEATASSGETKGVKGVTQSSNSGAAGVEGKAENSSGRTYGVAGYNDSGYTDSAGVYGKITAVSNTTTTLGVLGKDPSEYGVGVLGYATRNSGTNYGVFGRTDSSDGYAVFALGRLAAERSVAQTGATNLNRHVATVENTSGDSTGDVLGLKTRVDDPGKFMNFISFIDSDSQVGQIQGDGSGGIEFVGSLADFAEFFPKADPAREFEGGQVVGLRDGEVVAETTAVDAVLVVSDRPFLTGNKPLDDEAGDSTQDAFVKLSLVGQVPVRVRGPVDSGDVLVANPANDGTAVARRTTDRVDQPVVGQALDAHDGEAEVRALVGGPGLDAIPPDGAGNAPDQKRRRTIAEKDDRIEELEAAVERKDDRIDDLEDRLRVLETKVGVAGQPADD